MSLSFDGLLEAIQAAETITLFRHQHPDCDALGAQFGLKQWLATNFPDKKVYALGYETSDQGHWPPADRATDTLIRDSLAIVLDTANAARVDDARFLQASGIIQIDHHPHPELFGQMHFIYDDCAATCEILSDFMQNLPQYRMTEEIAAFLYKGILTDTLCYRTSNTTAHTLAMGTYLAGFPISIPALNRELFDQSLADFRFAGYLRSKVQIENDHLAYVILKNDELENWRLTAAQARNFIDEIGHVREFAVWALFTETLHEDRKEYVYDGSLRSKSIVVNDLAAQFHGGGHPCAAGVSRLMKQEVVDLLKQLSARISTESEKVKY